VDVTIQDDEHRITLQTEDLSVHIDRSGGRISFVTRHGLAFCADQAGMSWGATSWGAQGVACVKRIEQGEHFFGFGERTGPLDRRGRQMINWTCDPPHDHGPATDPLYIAIPVFLSLRPGLAYGLFLNSTWRSRFDMGASHPEAWVMETEGSELDYYVFYGPTPAEVLETLGMLLGTMPLPPRWALGYHQSRWGYKTEGVVRGVAAEFRRRDIPCDVIHLDIDYMDGYRVFTWHPDRFPDPRRLIADLRRDGFRVVTIVDPGVKVDTAYTVYQQGVERHMFIRKSNGDLFSGYVWPDSAVFPDFTRPDVQQWWGDLQKGLVEMGVNGIWNDMNEPTVFRRPFSQGGGQAGTIDLDARQGPEGEDTSHAEVHNLYGYLMARASYEGLCRHLGGERPFVLTRSGFAGIQRWSACWMGDNHSWWEHLEMSMPQLMNMGLSGVPFVGTDIGGFGGNATGDLFARWMQLGALSPFCRGHSSWNTVAHEPWAFGPRVEAICREYLKLRYRLLPYLYTLFWEAARRGAPVLRPLLYHYPNDPTTYQLHDQVMLGPFLMAAPIYQPGREYRYVYLPDGVWYDWWTDEMIIGPAHLLAHAPLERLPLYIRAGAIIPSGPDMAYTDQRPLDPLTLDLYPGDGEFTLYEDDGHTFAYEQGEFCTTTYLLHREHDRLVLQIGERTGLYIPRERQLVIRVHAIEKVNLADLPAAEYEEARRILSIRLPDDGKAHTVVFRPIG